MSDIVGKTLTYKQMCEELGIQHYGGGNQKKAQLKDLERYYKWEKEGTKYTIIKKYKTPLPIIDERAITSPNIEFILLCTLSSDLVDDKNTYYVTNKELLKLCCMINNNYCSILNDINRNSVYIADKYDFGESFVEYVNKVYDILKPTLASALKSMVNKKEIIINVGYKLKKDDKIIDVVSSNSDLGKEIFRIQGEAMERLGVKRHSDFWGRSINKRKDYYELCNYLVAENSQNNELWIENGWSFQEFFQCHEIILNTNKIKWDLEDELENKKELIDKVYDKLHSAKGLRDLTYNQIDKWFAVCNTSKGDLDYPIVEDIKQLQKKKY